MEVACNVDAVEMAGVDVDTCVFDEILPGVYRTKFRYKAICMHIHSSELVYNYSLIMTELDHNLFEWRGDESYVKFSHL